MNLQPPAGSKISIVTEGTDPTIIIPAATSPMRYFTGLFLLFWLGGWAPRIQERRFTNTVRKGQRLYHLLAWRLDLGRNLRGAHRLQGLSAIGSRIAGAETERRELRFRDSAASLRCIPAHQGLQGHLEFHLSEARSCRTRATPVAVPASARNRLWQPSDSRCRRYSSRYRVRRERGRTRMAGALAGAALRAFAGRGSAGRELKARQPVFSRSSNVQPGRSTTARRHPRLANIRIGGPS
jgi:hypothetical protein